MFDLQKKWLKCYKILKVVKKNTDKIENLKKCMREKESGTFDVAKKRGNFEGFHFKRIALEIMDEYTISKQTCHLLLNYISKSSYLFDCLRIRAFTK